MGNAEAPWERAGQNQSVQTDKQEESLDRNGHHQKGAHLQSPSAKVGRNRHRICQKPTSRSEGSTMKLTQEAFLQSTDDELPKLLACPMTEGLVADGRYLRRNGSPGYSSSLPQFQSG